MLCSDCDEEKDGVAGYGGGVSRQDRGRKRDRKRGEEKKKNKPASQKEGKESK